MLELMSWLVTVGGTGEEEVWAMGQVIQCSCAGWVALDRELQCPQLPRA
jgi:hypothetical protein